MEKGKKAKIIKELTKKGNFTLHYSKENQEWFIDKLIRVFELKKVDEEAIKDKVTEIVKKSKNIVDAKSKMEIGLNDKKARSKNKKLQIACQEILYGAIAHHPEFIDPKKSAIFDFIFRRRYRGVYRMMYFVRPGGYFSYPWDCIDYIFNRRWGVNEASGELWKHVYNDVYLSPLEPKIQQNGALDIKKSIDSLFVNYPEYADTCKRNLLDCSCALSVVLMDTLQESKDTTTLLNKIHSETKIIITLSTFENDPPNFLAMDGKEDKNKKIYKNGLFKITDTSKKPVTSKELKLLEQDIQVGDGCYISNHPLFKIVNPDSSWSGEYSILCQCGNRSNGLGEDGFIYTGHGFSGSKQKFYNDNINIFNTKLSEVFKIGKIFLGFKASDDTSISSNKYNSKEGKGLTIPEWLGQDKNKKYDGIIYEFYVDYKFFDETNRRTIKKEGFVILYIDDIPLFFLFPSKITKIDKALQYIIKNGLRGIMAFRGPKRIGEPKIDFNPVKWQINYFKKDSPNGEFFSLFTKDKKNVQFNRLMVKDLLIINPPVIRIYPKVDFEDPNYMQFLNQFGAV